MGKLKLHESKKDGYRTVITKSQKVHRGHLDGVRGIRGKDEGAAFLGGSQPRYHQSSTMPPCFTYRPPPKISL